MRTRRTASGPLRSRPRKLARTPGQPHASASPLASDPAGSVAFASEALDPDASVAARSGPGGPSKASVEAQIAALDALLGYP